MSPLSLLDLARSVKYKCQSGAKLDISQDGNIKDCTGGIVWETALLLATFLEQRGVIDYHVPLACRGARCPLCMINSWRTKNSQVNRLGWSEEDRDGREGSDQDCGKVVDGVSFGSTKKRGRDAHEPGASSKKKLKQSSRAVPRVLEVGAGCGLLGLVIAHLGTEVVLTEAPEAMELLASNVDKVCLETSRGMA